MFLEQVVDQISLAEKKLVHSPESTSCQSVAAVLRAGCLVMPVSARVPMYYLLCSKLKASCFLCSNILIFRTITPIGFCLLFPTSSSLLITAMFLILFWDGPGMLWGLKTGGGGEGKGLVVSKRMLLCNPRLTGVSELILSVCLSCLLKVCSSSSSCFWLLWLSINKAIHLKWTWTRYLQLVWRKHATSLILGK